MLTLEIYHIVLTAAALLLLGGYAGTRIAILFSLMQTSLGKEHQVTVLLEQAAREMAKHPVKQWPEWYTHLLRSLEGRAKAGEYGEVLEEIRDRIASRLESEQW